jgi:hypothetical protein
MGFRLERRAHCVDRLIEDAASEELSRFDSHPIKGKNRRIKRKIIRSMEMKSLEQQTVKTTVFFDRSLLDEIDRVNPFSTRREFLDRASREYLEKLRRREIDEQLASACAESAAEDLLESKAWEQVTLETWT